MSSGGIPSGLERRMKIVPACVPRKRLRRGQLLADIMEDRRSHPPLFFCLVQKQDSPEILFLGQFRSGSAAAKAAGQFMSEYLTRQQKSHRQAA